MSDSTAWAICMTFTGLMLIFGLAALLYLAKEGTIRALDFLSERYRRYRNNQRRREARVNPAPRTLFSRNFDKW